MRIMEKKMEICTPRRTAGPELSSMLRLVKFKPEDAKGSCHP